MMVGDYKKDMAEGGKATDELGNKIRKTGKQGQKDLDQLATTTGIFGAALIGVAGAAIYAAATFDKQMSEVSAVAGATSEELDQLRQAAIKAGEDTAFSATEAAKAEAELAKAGISAADILGGALTGALDLASAGSLDLAQAAEIAAAAMNTFDLRGQDVGHIADVLAAAANKSSAGVEDLGQGLQQVGLIAAQVDLTLEETVGLLAAFADRGLKGSDGATSLKTALLRLAAPTGKAAELMDELGISMYDANGNLVNAVTIAGQLETALKDLTPSQRNAALNTIFGSDAIRAANVLYEEGEAGIRDYIKAVDDQGAAARTAQEKLNNLAGDVEALKGSLETLFITAGGGSTGGLRFLTQAADRLVGAVSKLPDPVLGTATALTGIAGVGLLAGAATLKLRGHILDMAESLGGATTTAGKMTGKMAGLVSIAGKATAALAALTITAQILDELDVLDKIPILRDVFGQVDTALNLNVTTAGKAKKAYDILNKSMDEQVQTGQSLIEMWDVLNGAQVTTDKQMLEAAEAIEGLTEVFRENKYSMDSNTTAGLRNIVAMEEAAKEAVEAADAYLQQTGDIEGARNMLREYKDETVKATKATGEAKKQVEALADQLFKLPETKAVKLAVQIELNQAKQALLTKLKIFAEGGVVEHAQTGLLKDAHIASAMNPAIYAYAEPQTGGEAFVPKRGNYGKSMSILSHAAGWYGADVVPQGSRGGWYGGSQAVDVAVTLQGGDAVTKAVAERSRVEVRNRYGGSVQNYLGPRRR